MWHNVGSHSFGVISAAILVMKLYVAQTVEAIKHVIIHCVKHISYICKKFQQFCSQLNIEHETGIPYNPKGQRIAECALGSLKILLQKKRNMIYTLSCHIMP